MGAFGLIAAFVGGTAAAVPAGTQLLGPSAYRQKAQSPFAGEFGLVFETFEDGVLDLEGTSIDRGRVLDPSPTTDSVDIDDGPVDGSGSGGHSYVYGIGSIGLTITFDPDLIGGPPTRVGVVWTDGDGPITFEAFDTGGVSLGVITGHHADDVYTGTTPEDRFYGVVHDAGVGSIRIRNEVGGIEIDHVQFVDPFPVSCNRADLAEVYGVLDLVDINAFTDYFVAQDERGDLNLDGLFDLVDIALFIDAFVAGCA